jgi:hypothetical protein
MNPAASRRALRVFPLALSFLLLSLAHAEAQGARKTEAATLSAAEGDHERERSAWFLRGRAVPGKSAAELRHRAYLAKMQARASRAHAGPELQLPASNTSSNTWVPLGPAPLASDATGDGFQNYNQVSGRATAVAIDPADPTGNTVYIGGAQGGVWKSSNAAASVASSVIWTPVSDDQATLSVGAIAIQPGNSVPANSVILVGTGEADNSADSYFGLGILRSVDGGSSWKLVSTANSGTLSFSGLGATRMAFSTAQTGTVVAAMAASAEGEVEDSITGNTFRGLYTSTDAGVSWTYDALSAGGASEATSATSVVYNAAAGLFFAAVRYQGFYSSPDGLTWSLLANQPGAPGLLNPTACPQNYSPSCPIYRGEIAVVPGRNEMYVWFISLDSNNDPVDQGIWQSFDGGVTWAQINDSGIENCGDMDGCGVDQGFYNLELLAVPDCANGTETCAGNPTDLYAGAVNLYKCSITSVNTTCANTPFANLTHVYGCDPLGAPAHVHPDQHALAFAIPNSGSSSATDLMYFANDGGIYRALDGFSGLNSGSCSGTNQFDDLNQNLGSMTQFVSFSQHPTEVSTILGGTQDNGSPATATASSADTAWGNVLSGDGGYNAIDGNTGTWYASNPDFPPGTGSLNIQECPSGVNCNDSLFNVVVSSGDLQGDDGAFYFPYILDPQSATNMLIGTCRVWSGPRTGGAFTALSLNFDTLGIGTCAGTEINTVRALASYTTTGGTQLIYAVTDGPGPNNITAPIGGNVWVTTNAQAVSGVTSTFANVTMNGPAGASINPLQFPISSVAIDTSDTSGRTAYVTVMGFTGGPGHVWQTTNAGASWVDFTGSGADALPDSDSPVNAVVVDAQAQVVYVGTDMGVYQSCTVSRSPACPTSTAPAWTETVPTPGSTDARYLPNVAVTALALFSSGCGSLLRASTYGRGIWQFGLPASPTPDFCFAELNPPFPTVNAGSTTTQGAISVTSVDGFSGTVNLTCSIVGSGACSVSPTSVQTFPAKPAPEVTVNATNLTAGGYQLSVLGTSGSISNTLAIPFNVADFQLSGTGLTINAGEQGIANLSIIPSTYYAGSVNVSCNASALAGAKCLPPTSAIPVSPGPAVPVAATITVPSGAAAGVYNMTFTARDTSGNPIHNLTIAVTVQAGSGTGPGNNSFALKATQNFPAADAPSRTTAMLSVTPNYSGSVTAVCNAGSLAGGQCSVNPTGQIPIGAGKATSLTLTLNVPNSAAPQPSNSYSIMVTVTDASGQPTATLAMPLTVIQDFTLSTPSPGAQTVNPGQSASYNFSVLPVGTAFGGTVSFSCAPAAVTCSFVPTSVTPGGSSAAVVMTVTGSATASLSRRVGLWLLLPGVLLLVTWERRGRKLRRMNLGMALFLLLFLPSCGGGSNGGGGGLGPQGGITYNITVTGTSGTLSHPASPVTLVVQP